MNSRGPLPGVVGVPLSIVYGAVTRVRNSRYDTRRGVREPALPVISVGNLSVGGVGKTPVVQYIARLLIGRGFQPAIALRGYKAPRGRESDEEAEHRAALPGVRVIADPDRVRAVERLAAAPDRPDCVILDDGFQHRRLGRTLDLVLIDARRSPWRDRLLPAGWLREPVSALARADAVILTHVDLAQKNELDELVTLIGRTVGAEPVAQARHVWESLTVRTGVQSPLRVEPVSWLAGRRVVAMCSIGEPGQFLSMVRDAGAEVVERLIGRDHAPLDRRAVAQLLAGVEPEPPDAVVCTAKDWPRLCRVLPAGLSAPIAYPVLRVEVTQGEAELAKLVLGAVEGRLDRLETIDRNPSLTPASGLQPRRSDLL